MVHRWRLWQQHQLILPGWYDIINEKKSSEAKENKMSKLSDNLTPSKWKRINSSNKTIQSFKNDKC